MSKTPIEWTQETWNPVRGCSRISEGCRNCYAERQAARNLPGMKSPTTGEPFAVRTPSGPRWTGKVELIPHMLDVPLRRKVPTTYFVNSMSDLFHESLPDEAIDQVFAVMALCPQHTFQVLTKRAERMREYFSDESHERRFVVRPSLWGWPLPNVWLGVSVEHQANADARIPHLLATPSAVRFLSCEPLLGPVDLMNLIDPPGNRPRCLQQLNALTGWRVSPEAISIPKELRGVDWVIVGGESGPGARPMHPDFARSIRDQCVAARVPFFFKQWGEWVPRNMLSIEEDWPIDEQTVDGTVLSRAGKKRAGRLLDGREWNEMPAAASAASATVGQGDTDSQDDSNGV